MECCQQECPIGTRYQLESCSRVRLWKFTKSTIRAVICREVCAPGGTRRFFIQYDMYFIVMHSVSIDVNMKESESTKVAHFFGSHEIAYQHTPLRNSGASFDIISLCFVAECAAKSAPLLEYVRLYNDGTWRCTPEPFIQSTEETGTLE